MELRTINPRKLKFNPNNPRRTKVAPEQDAMLTANIQAQGLLQPPVVRQDGDDLVIIAGERRVRCAIKAKLSEIYVLVRDSDAGGDAMRSLAENVVRAEMCSVDLWRHIEAMLGSDQGWNEQGIATALNMSLRSVKRLRLLANIHPSILDHMASGDEPDHDDLAAIANASIHEQAEVWKQHKPKKGTEASWWSIVNPLKKRRLLRKDARFGDDLARKFGIAWEDDLFGQGGEDNLYTTLVAEFFAAQTEWLATELPNLHQRASIIEKGSYGQVELPSGAQRTYGNPQEGDEMGFYLDDRTGAVESVTFRIIARAKSENGIQGGDQPKGMSARADVTQKGVTMIGDYRTDALHQALKENEIDDQTMIGLLVLALAGTNVTVQSPVQKVDYYARTSDRALAAYTLIEGGTLTQDADVTRDAARTVLCQVLSCKDGMTNSGAVARVAGDAIGADRFLPSMGTDEFLKCLSKGAMERAATAISVLPRQTGKATRAAMLEHIGTATYILPAARFALTAAEQKQMAAATAPRSTDSDVDGIDDDNNVDDIDGDNRSDADPDVLPGGDGADGESDEARLAASASPMGSAGLDALAA